MPHAPYATIMAAFLKGRRERTKQICPPNPYHDFDRGAAYALGAHWEEPKEVREPFLEQVVFAGIGRKTIQAWAEAAA